MTSLLADDVSVSAPTKMTISNAKRGVIVATCKSIIKSTNSQNSTVAICRVYRVFRNNIAGVSDSRVAVSGTSRSSMVAFDAQGMTSCWCSFYSDFMSRWKSLKSAERWSHPKQEENTNNVALYLVRREKIRWINLKFNGTIFRARILARNWYRGIPA